MPLSTHVQNRYGTQYLIELTNPQARGPNTINTTLLGFTAGDIEAMFDVYAGVVYDDTDAQHIAIGTEGVVALLIRRTGQVAGNQRFTEWLDALRALGTIEGRNRVTPDSNTLLQPSADDRLSSTPRPAFDDRNFDAFLPNPARGSSLKSFEV